MRVGILTAALLWALAGCGGGADGPRPTPSATPPATATATTSPSAVASATATRPSASPTARATASATASPTPTVSPSATPTATASPDLRLRALAARAGRWVGAAFVEGSQAAPFREVLAREFNSTTAPLYWQTTEGQRGVFDFRAADEAVAVADAAGLRLRGHPLVWGRLALPDWVRAITQPDDLRAAMTAHIEALVGRYRGRIAQYDVVNEPLTFDGAPGRFGNGLEDYVFSRVLGTGYVREALEIAHAADPDAALFINELLVMRPGPKQDAFFALARELRESGAPLHGVGLQGHITPPFAADYLPTRDEIAATVARFAALGLRVEITELDVSLTDPGAQLEQQAAIYGDVFAGCFRTPGCDGITTWGLTDRDTWIRNFFHVEAAPLLFDADYQPKPAYFAAREQLRQLVE